MTWLHRQCRALGTVMLVLMAWLAASVGSAATVSHIGISSRYQVNAQQVRELLNTYIGREVTAGLLQDVLDSLNRYYRTHGFPYATAYYPEQITQEGSFEVEVREPPVGRLHLQNRSEYVRNSAIRRVLGAEQGAGASADDIFDDLGYAALRERLLQLYDLDAVELHGFHSQDSSEEPLKLFLELRDKPRLSGGVFIDNRGTRAAGRTRVGARGTMRSPSGNLDRLTLAAARSDHGQNNVALSYEIPVNQYFTTVGFGVCYSDYELGDRFKALDASGSAVSAEIFVRQPVLRGEHLRLELNAGGRYRRSRDRLGLFDATFEKHTLSGYGGAAFAWSSPQGLSVQAGTRLTGGQLTNDDDWGLYEDHSYLIFNLDYRVSYEFMPGLSVSGNGQVQLANTALDGADAFQAAGPDAVAAFDTSAAVGDEGLMQRLALHYRVNGDLSFSVSPHADAGWVKNRQGGDSRHVFGAGLELSASFHGVSLTVELDHALGSVPEGQDSGRIWVSAAYRYG